MWKAAVTDYGFDNLDIEKSILEPLGCQLIAQKTAGNQAQLGNLVKDADAVITQFAPVTAAVIDAMKKCRIIVRYGIGVDNVDLKAAAAKNIPVCNIPDFCTDEVADHTLTFILAMVRQLMPCVNTVKAGHWNLPSRTHAAIRSLKGATVGIVAFGRIGREVAQRLQPFKCRIIVFDPVLSQEKIRTAGCEPVNLETLYAQSDIITLHCPSTEQTRYMINAETLAQMKPGVILVNASRGTLVKTPDLITALQQGQVAAAALDVTDPEPIDSDSPLVKMDNVIITSHIAATSPQAAVKLQREAALAVARMVKGEPLINVVNGVKGGR
ncbi:MAG: C-terminal binding protein [Victivallales bacterium]|nr:C-terminal binding protein [Victivallales bacterium]